MTETEAKALLAELESILSGCDDFLTGYRLTRLIEDITGRLTQHHATPTEELHMTQLEMFAEVEVEVHTGNEPEEGVEVQVIVGEEPSTQEEVRKELLRVAAALNEMADRVAKVIVDVTGAALKA